VIVQAILCLLLVLALASKAAAKAQYRILLETGQGVDDYEWELEDAAVERRILAELDNREPLKRAE
jgi:hypothetical protein